MPFTIIRNDITKMKTDAIVNAANSSLLGGGGVDGAIHRAAGSELLHECRLLGGCKTGQAKATKGYRLACKHIIHTVGPVWRGGENGEEELLYSCYSESLKLAKKLGCESVAFPLISAGIYGYPVRQAIGVATRAIGDFLEGNDMDIYLVIYGNNTVIIGEQLYGELERCMDGIPDGQSLPPLRSSRISRVPELFLKKASPFFGKKVGAKPEAEKLTVPKEKDNELPMMGEAVCAPAAAAEEDSAFDSLDEILGAAEETFSETLLRLIDERGLTDPQVYRKANIDRRLFSKIRSDRDYKPKKQTVLAFAIALELDLAETEQLLEKAGFALSPSIRADLIIKYFIVNGRYDIFEINEALFSFDQALIGA